MNREMIRLGKPKAMIFTKPFPADKEIFYRGSVLSKYVEVERILGTILSLLNEDNLDKPDYKPIDFKHLTNKKKIEQAEKMIKERLPVIYAKHEQVFIRLDNLRLFRNILSHCTIQLHDSKPDTIVYWDLTEAIDDKKLQTYESYEYPYGDLDKNLNELIDIIAPLTSLLSECIDYFQDVVVDNTLRFLYK